VAGGGDQLKRELDCWLRKGLVARFWWRDDDAQEECEHLERLLALAVDVGAEIVLAVSPMLVSPAFADTLNDRPFVYLAAHGYRHANHSRGPGRGEFGPDRPLPTMQAEIAELTDRYRRLFRGDHALAMFVPPWHKFDDRLVPDLLQAGYHVLAVPEAPRLESLIVAAGRIAIPSSLPAVSRKPRPQQAGQIARSETLGVLAYHSNTGAFDERLPGKIAGALRLRRLGLLPLASPVGMLTHHREHDETTWKRFGAVARLLAEHAAAAWTSPTEICPPFTTAAARQAQPA
jgi:hypothetical protein